ncbi:hypothetical protein ACFWMR_26605 [Amycolatopsis thailandensis]|uniref:hypothetical protein n=1 Tax=Amycolatopsis thailandensis TaxID=589330 RepID=UPI00364A6C26
MDDIIAGLDTSTFRPVEGFAVRLFPRGSGLGHGMRFVGGDDTVLAEFSWWDNVEVTLRGWTLDDVPLGTPREPFFESDQCWLLLIWREGEDVLIAETDDPHGPVFERRSRVPGSAYLDAWTVALREARSPGP